MSRLISIPLVLSALLLAGCGDDDEAATTETMSEAEASGAALDVSAVPDGSLEFEQDSLESEPGTVVATFRNPAPIAHDFCVEGEGGEELGCTDIVADGNTSTAEFDLGPGEYTYFCSVAGHREGGMEGTLMVE